jgi:quinol monooxygenase YgiN
VVGVESLDPRRANASGLRIAYKEFMAIVIVQGVFSLEPEERDRFVEASVEGMRVSRREDGCLEYVMAADPLDRERAILSERWESMEHLDRHLAQQRQAASGVGNRPTPRSIEITLFEVASSRPLR